MGYWKGRPQGQKAALSTEAIATIRRHLDARDDPLAVRDRALFALAIDSMLRGIDLLALRVGDVLDHTGAVRATLVSNQSKIARGGCKPVSCYLGDRTRAVLASHVAGKRPSDWLFTGKGRATPITTQQLRKLVKRWCAETGLDPAQHACHSTRRSKASLLYRQTRDLDLVRQALGQTHLTSTQAYLAVGQEQVEAACRALEL
jgi:site-specific recombinase XerD